jgi:hypothetical protein
VNDVAKCKALRGMNDSAPGNKTDPGSVVMESGIYCHRLRVCTAWENMKYTSIKAS